MYLGGTLEFELEKIDHVHVYVRDRKQSEAWYKSVLGFYRTTALEFWAVDGGPLTLQNESGSIHLALFERQHVDSTTVAFKVSADALDWWVNHLNGAGLPVVPVNHDVSWSIYFKDPDGNAYEITSYDYDEFASLLATTA